MAKERIELSQEWKQAFEKGEYQCFSQKVSLYDLLFYKKDGGSHYLRAGFSVDGSNTFHGLPLKHSTIAVDTSQIKKSGKHYSYQAPASEDEDIQNAFKKLKIEVALPSFDLRAKPAFLTSSNIESMTDEDVSRGSFERELASFAPEKLGSSDYFYSLQEKSGLSYAPGIKVFSKEAVQNLLYADSFSSSLSFAIDSEIATEQLKNDKTIDFVLCDEDASFESKFLDETPALKAYSSVAFNINASFWQTLFYSYYSFEKQAKLFTLSNDGLSASMSSLVTLLMKNCFVLVKAPFYADYIDYKDFGQQLSQTADVVHRNLMVSANADFERFDTKSDDSTDDAKTTRPYLPTTVPTIDRFASSLLQDSTLEEVIESAKKPGSPLGALQTQTFESANESQRSSTSKKDTETLSPLWLDPDSRSTAADYDSYIPAMMPKDGNLYVDGRIISRSIDELWEAIKRMESGRDSDSNIRSKTDLGYPTAEADELKTTTDTRPFLKKMKFNAASGVKTGDPTYITYSDSSTLKFTVKEWVNDPDKIKYELLDELKKLFGWDYNVEDSLLTTSKAIEEVEALEEYAPSSSPLTLRELEAALRGLQYSLAYLTNYSKRHFVRAGKLGVTANAGTYKETAGTLYQLHRSFLNDGSKAARYEGVQSLGKLEATSYGTSQDDVPSKSVFMSANGTWQSVGQFMNLRIRTDEEF